MDFIAVFSDPASWIELGTLMFLELALGIDNLVFIFITAGRLPESKRHIGRRLGLMGALCMRIALLCAISFLASLTVTLFVIPFIPGTAGEVTARDLIMLAGGIYLIYKGIEELVSMLKLKEETAEVKGHPKKRIGLLQAIALIMVMDVVFSLDSVITAVGLVNDLPIMILAVICAVVLMIIFADPIADFIDRHSGIKILALCFIAMVGVVLTAEGFNLELDKNAVYFAMGFALIGQLVEIKCGIKGACISGCVLLVASIVLWIAMPDVIAFYMGIIGFIVAAVVVALLYFYEKNLKELLDSHAAEQS